MDPIFTVSVPQIKAMIPNLDDGGVGDDFLIIEFNGADVKKRRHTLEFMTHPCRFEGLVCVFCLKGSFGVNINLNHYPVGEGSVIYNVPGNVFSLAKLTPEQIENLEGVCLATSLQFISTLRVDFKKICEESVQQFSSPCIKLTSRHLEMAKDYFLILRKILATPFSNKKSMISGLLSSLSSLIGDAWQQNRSSARPEVSGGTVRSQKLMERFLTLVTEYHTSQRGMAFYAEKMSLTPKYLSRVVKQVSGRSAPDWIDSFVILEAQNLLRFSDIPIKEIVYRLNFPNQSVFYKFFKAHTGMTPSAYRHS